MSWHILQLLVVRSRQDTPIASSVWWEVKSNTEYNLARYLYRFWTGMRFRISGFFGLPLTLGHFLSVFGSAHALVEQR